MRPGVISPAVIAAGCCCALARCVRWSAAAISAAPLIMAAVVEKAATAVAPKLAEVAEAARALASFATVVAGAGAAGADDPETEGAGAAPAPPLAALVVDAVAS